jgi:hypothetical protein
VDACGVDVDERRGYNFPMISDSKLVMAGLVPAIHVLL